MEGKQCPQATLWGLLDPQSDPAPQLPTLQGLTCISAGFPSMAGEQMSMPLYLRHSPSAGPQMTKVGRAWAALTELVTFSDPFTC